MTTKPNTEMLLKEFKAMFTPGVKFKLAKSEVRNPQSSKVAGQTVVNAQGASVSISPEGWYERNEHKMTGQIRSVVKYGKKDIVFQTEDGRLSYLTSPTKGEVFKCENGFVIQTDPKEEYGTRLTYALEQ